MNAAECLERLRRHYIPPGRYPAGYFAAEVASPNGNRRADAIWLPLANRSNFGLIGHEIKVTRADLRAELEDPKKANQWKQYCRQWWLVVPDASIVDGFDIPHDWGVMFPPLASNRRAMRILRPAPFLAPEYAEPGYRRLIAHQLSQARRDVLMLEIKNSRLLAEIRRAELLAKNG